MYNTLQKFGVSMFLLNKINTCDCNSIYNVTFFLITVLSVNEYTPFEKYNFKQYLNEHKNHFQNVDKTKFNVTSV